MKGQLLEPLDASQATLRPRLAQVMRRTDAMLMRQLQARFLDWSPINSDTRLMYG
jgi:hypothetical protein